MPLSQRDYGIIMVIVKRGKIAVLLAVAFGVTLMTSSFVAHAAEGAGVQGYTAAAPLQDGTIVELTDSRTGTVGVASQSDRDTMFGVTVNRNQLPVTLSSGDREKEVFVAVSGTYDVLVSTQTGPIQAGDYVTLSSIDGVAMKAGTEEVTVFGRAAGSFDGKGVVLGTTTLQDTSGNDSQQVALGSVPVTIDIRSNPNNKSTKANLPEMLERIGEAIAEKEVSPIRIYLSLGITIVSVIAAIAILYAGVRNGMRSIGRNPMSKRSIFKALLQVILTSALILIIGLFAVYLLLKL